MKAKPNTSNYSKQILNNKKKKKNSINAKK